MAKDHRENVGLWVADSIFWKQMQPGRLDLNALSTVLFLFRGFLLFGFTSLQEEMPGSDIAMTDK